VAGVDGDAFLNAIAAQDAGPLASRPITLTPLLQSYVETGSVPRSRTELYRGACLRLCRAFEGDDGARPAPLLTPGQRYSIASRTAALVVFCNRAGISRAAEDPAFLPESDIVGGQEHASSLPFEVSRPAVDETVRTAIFSALGRDRNTFAHVNYAEFLASEYIRERGLSIEKVIELLRSQTDPGGALVPQLRSVAAWIASAVPKAIPWLLDIDPQAVLACDVAALTARDKERLVTSLLDWVTSLGHVPWSLRASHISKLNHDGITPQLKPLIEDPSRPVASRTLAIEIAGACSLTELAPQIMIIAMSHEELLDLRKEAAYTAAKLGCRELGALLDCTNDEDPDGELRGIALRALYPAHLSGGQLFEVVRATPLWEGLSAYTGFLHRLPDVIREEDLESGLLWTLEVGESHSIDLTLRRLMTALLDLSWRALPTKPDLEEPFCRAILARARHFDSVGPQGADLPFGVPVYDADADLRHRLVRALVGLEWAPGVDAAHLVSTAGFLFHPSDRDWLIERLDSAASDQESGRWADILAFMFARAASDAEDISALWDACQSSDSLRERFRRLFEPVELESDQASAARKTWELHQRFERRHERRALSPSPAERVAEGLRRCLEDASRWWQLTRDLSLEALDTHYSDDWRIDVRAFVGWQSADDNVRAAIVAAAKRFLEEKSCRGERWLGRNVIEWDAIAGYRALVLAHFEDREWLSSRPGEFWDRWADVVVAHPAWHESDEIGESLVAMAFHAVPQHCTESLLARVRQEDQDGGGVTCLGRARLVADSRLDQAVGGLASSGGLTPDGTHASLRFLFERNEAAAKRAAVELIARREEGGDAHRRAASAAENLLFALGEDAWEEMWPAVESDPDLGEELMSYAVRLDRRTTLSDRVSPARLGHLLDWLLTRYPPGDDPDIPGVHMVSEREQVGDLRRDLLYQLRDVGNEEALRALERLECNHTELPWLSQIVAEAQTIARFKSWVPPTPKQFMRLAAEDQARFVDSEEELARLVVESLRLLERELQGEDELVATLWNTRRGDVRPKDERSLSQTVRRHLARQLSSRGVVVNREVEVGNISELDVRVSAARPGRADVLNVVVEVKGCWNRELLEAMKSQLSDRYMPDARSTQGIYVVGGFLCDVWTKDDYRKSDARTNENKDYRSTLSEQAASLSKDGRKICFVCLDATLHARAEQPEPDAAL
jgi:hypothetical protein